MSPVSSIGAGVQMAVTRLRSRSSIGIGVATLLAVVVIAFVERREGAAGASDRSLAAVFRFVIPLLAFALSQLPIGTRNLRDAVWPAARYGAHRGFVAVGHVLAGASAAAMASLITVVLVVLVARAGAGTVPGEMTLASDLLTTAWIAPLVAIAYATWFGLGATFGRSGGGRGIVLLADFVVGSLGLFGVLLPRGSAYNLIGLAAPLDVPQRAVSGVLVVVSIVCLALGALRCRR